MEKIFMIMRFVNKITITGSKSDIFFIFVLLFFFRIKIKIFKKFPAGGFGFYG